MKLLDQPGAEEGLKERIGCLISEVVIPGWTPDQHVFIDEQKVSGSHLTGEMRGRR
jgi:hypothetical protein